MASAAHECGAKCSALAAKQGLQPWTKGWSFKPDFCKATRAADPLEGSSANSPGCPFSFSRHVRVVQLQLPPGSAGARRGARTGLGGYCSRLPSAPTGKAKSDKQERKSWPSARLNAMIPATASFPSSLPPHPAAWVVWRVVSQALIRVCECWGGAVALLSVLFFACGSACSCLPAAFLTMRGVLWFTGSQVYEPACGSLAPPFH